MFLENYKNSCNLYDVRYYVWCTYTRYNVWMLNRIIPKIKTSVTLPIILFFYYFLFSDNIKSIRSIEISSAFTQLSQKTGLSEKSFIIIIIADQNSRTALVEIHHPPPPPPVSTPDQITLEQSGARGSPQHNILYFSVLCISI